MEVSFVFATRPPGALCFSSTPISKNPKPIALPTYVPPPLPQQRVSTSICSTGAVELIGVRRKPSSATKQVSKSMSEERAAALRDIQDSSELTSALMRSGEVLRAQDLNILLRHFGQQNRWDDICQLFDWMRQHEKTNFASYSSYIKLVGRGSNALKVLELYNSIKDESTKNNVSVCNSVLYCLIKSGKFHNALKLFDQMKQAGLVPDIVTYSTLLVGCAKVKDGYAQAMKLVQEIKYMGLCMDIVLYGTIISVCASNNECEEAEKYFDEMKGSGFSPNVFHYSSLLNAYAINGNYGKADELIKEMKSAGIVMNKVILTTLLKVYVKGGLFDKSRELLEELECLGYAEDEMPYCLLMDGLAKSDRVMEAVSIFDKMRQKQVKNDGYSYSIMISAFCRSGLIKEAKQLASEFEIRLGKYDLVILNSMLVVYSRSGEMENVMKTMKKMDELAISPDWNTFHILIKYFCEQQLYLLAYRTMKDMHSKGYWPEEGLAVSLIYHLGKAGAHAEAFSVYNMLKYSKWTINKALHEKILHILLSGGLLKEAYVVVKVLSMPQIDFNKINVPLALYICNFQDNAKSISQRAIKKFATYFMRKGNINLVNDVIKAVHSSGYKVDQDIFYMAISRYIEQPEKTELLLHLLHWMPGQGYVVDSAARTLIHKKSHMFGRDTIAELLSKHSMVLKQIKQRRG